MLTEGASVKRFLWAVTGALAGWVVWSKVQEEREERDLWAEVTDSFGETPDGNTPPVS